MLGSRVVLKRVVFRVLAVRRVKRSVQAAGVPMATSAFIIVDEAAHLGSWPTTVVDRRLARPCVPMRSGGVFVAGVAGLADKSGMPRVRVMTGPIITTAIVVGIGITMTVKRTNGTVVRITVVAAVKTFDFWTA